MLLVEAILTLDQTENATNSDIAYDLWEFLHVEQKC